MPQKKWKFWRQQLLSGLNHHRPTNGRSAVVDKWRLNGEMGKGVMVKMLADWARRGRFNAISSSERDCGIEWAHKHSYNAVWCRFAY